MQNKKYKVGGLFSGVGGIELGFKKTNKFKIAWSTDVDSYAAKTYRANFKHKFYEEDINNLDGKTLEAVDILVGGFPCQAFSVAGYRKGFEDQRGNVFFQIIRIINELPRKPKVLLLENVKNIFTHDNKRTFKIIQDSLEQTGYFVSSEIMNTSEYTEIPQNRERTFIICFLEGRDADFDPTKPMTRKFKTLFPPEPSTKKTRYFREFLEQGQVEDKYYYRQDTYFYPQLVEEVTRCDRVYQWRRKYFRENKSGVCPTLTANMGTGGHNVPIIKVGAREYRKLTPRECFNLQGFPKDFKFPDGMANGRLYKQAGNSVTVDIIERIANILHKSLDQKQ